ncbi:MAG: winged helix-turn-helix transcriptional regulator [Deltaproteobacteria bacterium]|nr:winged helix-turn-helix transcriptional regulator [Deltaproteobacteria bacterium]MBK8234568.1 winged helix-turn-helix transcriptional regulator [Deltaproteobacteria bacterium]MBK8715310.1 winged helix-turn-helix transcriptional regulator [Deltaproteobacteria bacterium]MBP7284987.1 winged helix-turn-helix transcriptional regulator [Nannocystaceae bacterium]
MSTAPRASDTSTCADHEHGRRQPPVREPEAVERAVRLFRALGDEARLRTLDLLVPGEACVSEIAASTGERVSTVSHRLRLLRAEGLVTRRRDGRHIYYALADRHVLELVENALVHATEEHHKGGADHDDDDDDDA